ncbi:MAG TPA: RluA family pseudouridine synthase [Clostridia bacterium]|nr:RluA family pseudouridine synthase [Clostridia bacterium]
MKHEVSGAKDKTPIIEYMTGALGFSSRQAKKLIKDKKAQINGKRAFRDSSVKNGDILELDTSEEQKTAIASENIPISVIYEDKLILAVNKPPFMLVHPTPNHPGGTLLNAAAHYFREKGEGSSLRLLNRLDMNTSGVVIIPKSAAVHSRLDEMMRSGSIRKFYTAVVEGTLEPEKGRIEEPIGKDAADPVKRKVTVDGQPSVTIYETLRKSGSHSLVRLELVTGRTHQIRVHLSHIGHPVTGDELYGKGSALIGRQALHASDIELPNPGGGGTLKLHGSLPGDMRLLIGRLELE